MEMKSGRWLGPDMHGFIGHGRKLLAYPKNSEGRAFRDF